MTPGIAVARILICDDNDNLRLAIALGLRREGYAVTEAGRGADAIAFLTDEPCGYFDAVIMDYSLDFGMTGGEAVNEMRRCCPDQPVIWLSGHELPSDLRHGELFLRKPAELEEIIAAVERLLRATRDTEPPTPK